MFDEEYSKMSYEERKAVNNMIEELEKSLELNIMIKATEIYITD